MKILDKLKFKKKNFKFRILLVDDQDGEYVYVLQIKKYFFWHTLKYFYYYEPEDGSKEMKAMQKKLNENL